MLGTRADELAKKNIVVAEVASTNDVNEWAKKINNDWALAGAGDFFTAILDQRYKATTQTVPGIELPHVYVCGTSFDNSKEFIRQVEKQNDCVLYMPFYDESWFAKAHDIIAQQKKLIIAIGEAEDMSALALRTAMAKAVRQILEKEKVVEVFIEGGSTAGAVLQEMKITTMYPVNEIQRGVVRMKTNDIFFTMKPGSYELSQQIKNLYLNRAH
jgi:glutamine amidotransferase PdxT